MAFYKKKKLFNVLKYYKLYLPGNLLISNESCLFSSYDIGLALSSSSESKASAGVEEAFFFFPGVLEFAFGLFGAAFGAAVAPLGPLTPIKQILLKI